MDTYTTTQGDTWDSIAYKVWGDGFLMDRMIEANPDYADVFIFSSGIELVVPDISDIVVGDFPEWFSE